MKIKPQKCRNLHGYFVHRAKIQIVGRKAKKKLLFFNSNASISSRRKFFFFRLVLFDSVHSLKVLPKSKKFKQMFAVRYSNNNWKLLKFCRISPFYHTAAKVLSLWFSTIDQIRSVQWGRGEFCIREFTVFWNHTVHTRIIWCQ